MAKSWEELTLTNTNKAGFECRAVEWVQVQIPAEELELKWSELMRIFSDSDVLTPKGLCRIKNRLLGDKL